MKNNIYNPLFESLLKKVNDYENPQGITEQDGAVKGTIFSDYMKAMSQLGSKLVAQYANAIQTYPKTAVKIEYMKTFTDKLKAIENSIDITKTPSIQLQGLFDNVTLNAVEEFNVPVANVGEEPITDVHVGFETFQFVDFCQRIVPLYPEVNVKLVALPEQSLVTNPLIDVETGGSIIENCIVLDEAEGQIPLSVFAKTRDDFEDVTLEKVQLVEVSPLTSVHVLSLDNVCH